MVGLWRTQALFKAVFGNSYGYLLQYNQARGFSGIFNFMLSGADDTNFYKISSYSDWGNNLKIKAGGWVNAGICISDRVGLS